MTKIPISKRSKYDIPNFLVWVIGYWNLGFICYLVLEIWYLRSHHTVDNRIESMPAT